MNERDSPSGRDFEQTRIDFLDAEIDLSFTFLNLALSHTDEPDVLAHDIGKAQQGYETALAWVEKVRDADHLTRLSAKLAKLRERLDTVRQQTFP
jgi:hypothetical protein